MYKIKGDKKSFIKAIIIVYYNLKLKVNKQNKKSNHNSQVLSAKLDGKLTYLTICDGRAPSGYHFLEKSSYLVLDKSMKNHTTLRDNISLARN